MDTFTNSSLTLKTHSWHWRGNDPPFVVAPFHEPPARSPDEAKRNPGMKSKYIPDSHPGYKLVQGPCAASGRIREARNDEAGPRHDGHNQFQQSQLFETSGEQNVY